jgi:hypothetical protein
MSEEKITKRVVDALRAPKPSKVGVKVRETFVWDKELHDVHVFGFKAAAETSLGSLLQADLKGRPSPSTHLYPIEV